MKTRAAVFYGPGRPLEVRDIELEERRDDCAGVPSPGLELDQVQHCTLTKQRAARHSCGQLERSALVEANELRLGHTRSFPIRVFNVVTTCRPVNGERLSCAR